jgi:hypothetical protein
MGITGPLPPNVTDKIDPAQRQAGGPRLQTNEEAGQKAAERSERKEQKLFAGILRQRKERGELQYRWTATHKPNTDMPGVADFWIGANGRLLQLEFKAYPGARLSSEQKTEKECATAAGNDYRIVYSADEAVSILRKWLG